MPPQRGPQGPQTAVGAVSRQRGSDPRPRIRKRATYGPPAGWRPLSAVVILAGWRRPRT